MLLTPAVAAMCCCFCVPAAAAAGWHSTGAVNEAVAPAGNFSANGRRVTDSELRPVHASASTKECRILFGEAAESSAYRGIGQQQIVWCV
jgi:hypothetical protein